MKSFVRTMGYLFREEQFSVEKVRHYIKKKRKRIQENLVANEYGRVNIN